ncbi:MAG: ribosome small subunit-dependent GTPase A [Candidatus Schekmanbacteria bacterium RBG_13_48_7]|uniref:Small ribosomal subunit biogenesis GTPase RsgA n=1 Tax=Candidatus Schekmanbacteria bacterium RBG_13_48_7 TaxID=1817878 RepID=A0A1F7S198_9BACT|nr:MAG: ribosome small subunit-dependent GTPase A [Candidatus Schekmanbacteria bacterium RBG_13_48_7]
MKKGKIICIEGGFSRVDIENEIFLCDLRRRLIGPRSEIQTQISVGDEVSIEIVENNHGVITQLHPRRNKLSRLSPGFNRAEDIIVANIDLQLIVVSVREPKLNTGLLNRFLVIGEKEKISSVICVNKIDLIKNSDDIQDVNNYKKLGYPVYFTSAIQNNGIEELKIILKGKTTVFIGASGVGKSSLLNSLQPELNLRTREVSATTSKGRHTTTTPSLLKWDFGGYVVDTPGLRELGLWNISKKEVGSLFPEIFSLQDKCKFRNCVHIHEPGCAIINALESGIIDQQRYKSYKLIYQSLEE